MSDMPKQDDDQVFMLQASVDGEYAKEVLILKQRYYSLNKTIQARVCFFALKWAVKDLFFLWFRK